MENGPYNVRNTHTDLTHTNKHTEGRHAGSHMKALNVEATVKRETRHIHVSPPTHHWCIG